jgi:uncharacterized protein YndB with AHSA1/START domain
MEPITIQETIQSPVEKVWKLWNDPASVQMWNHASDDWECPRAENDLRVGGTFVYTMAAKDKSVSFDFGGTYTNVEENKLIEYMMSDGRKVRVVFESEGGLTNVIETFDPENENPIEMQRGGWQAILTNFKNYVEGN